MENANKKYEEFKQKLISRIQEDLQKSKHRLDAHIQSNSVESIAFEKGIQNSLATCLFDINDLDRDMNEYDKLWNDASDMMIDLDIKYNRDTCMSLDEYLYEYYDSLEQSEINDIKQLLEQLSNTNL